MVRGEKMTSIAVSVRLERPMYSSLLKRFGVLALSLGVSSAAQACGSPADEDVRDEGTGGASAAGGDGTDTSSGGAPDGAGGLPDGGGGLPGAGGASSGGAPSGAGGNPSGAGGLGSSAGGMAAGSGGADTVGFSANRDDFGLGAASLCAGQFTMCESFESTAPGGLPAGLSLTGYGTRTAAVAEAQSARGARSLQIDVSEGQSAVVAMLQVAGLESLSVAHFGRMFYMIEGPGVSEFVHFDVLEFVGPWMTHQNGVRFASTGTGVGTEQGNWSWIYNVQPFDGGGAEFGSEGDRSAHPIVDEWMCLEWEFDAGAQTATYYHDGAAIDYLVIDTERSEIPEFSEFKIGFQKFQQTGAFRVWVDEVAFNETRIGCNH